MVAHSLKNIAIFGATGNIGLAIIEAILERKEEFSTITALTTNDPSNSKFDNLKQEGVKIVKISFQDNASLVAGLKGNDAVIIALGGII